MRAGKLCDVVAPNLTQPNQNTAGTQLTAVKACPGTWSLAAWSLDLENMDFRRSRGTGHHLGGHTHALGVHRPFCTGGHTETSTLTHAHTRS